MRLSDLAKLRTPYSNPADTDSEFARALGIDIHAIHELWQMVFEDLDETIFGIGWWAPHPGTRRRILISHYLIECIKSIEVNLIEASLHLHEALEFWEKENEIVKHAASIGPDRRLRIHMPKREKPEDDLAQYMARMHAVDFFRAATGAFDCLAGACVGVLGLAIPIKQTSFGQVRRAVGSSSPRLHQEFLTELDAVIARSGPQGWLDWMIAMRNMVVHRGRRWRLVELLPKPSGIYGPYGVPVLTSTATERLPPRPQDTQIEAFLSTATPVLTETAEDSLRGALRSSIQFVQSIGQQLISAWQTRKSSPALILQPFEQWPSIACDILPPFDGFKPGSAPYDPSSWHGNPKMGRQFRTAALDDDLRNQWKDFD